MSDRLYQRREVVGAGVGAVAALGLGAAFWQGAFDGGDGDSKAPSGPLDPYGPPAPADANGIRLPEGFEARRVARGGERIEGSDYTWHLASDGAATFETRDGGWILVSNSEAAARAGRGRSTSTRTARSATPTASWTAPP